MKHLVISVWLVASFSNLFSQSDTTKDSGTDLYIAKCIEIPAQYPGGLQALKSLLIDNMNYKLLKGEDRLPISVTVQFTVDTLGNTNYFKILQSGSPKFEDEAIRLLGLLKKWKPATLNGEKIDYSQIQTIVFIEFPDKKQPARQKSNGR